MKSYRTQFAALEADGQRRLTHPDLVRREVVWIRPTSWLLCFQAGCRSGRTGRS